MMAKSNRNSILLRLQQHPYVYDTSLRPRNPGNNSWFCSNSLMSLGSLAALQLAMSNRRHTPSLSFGLVYIDFVVTMVSNASTENEVLILVKLTVPTVLQEN